MFSNIVLDSSRMSYKTARGKEIYNRHKVFIKYVATVFLFIYLLQGFDIGSKGKAASFISKGKDRN